MQNSPVKQIKFKNLLKTWELANNPTLTLAVTKNICAPKSDPKMDSQSEGGSQKFKKKLAWRPSDDWARKMF